MSLNIDLLEESFAAIAPQGKELATSFYRNLFSDFPEVRHLFAEVNMDEQQKKLVASLKLTVENLRRPEVLVPVLENLGQQHVDYGAVEEHYPAVGQSLLKSLGEVAGESWTEELEDAWADAYQEIAKVMLAGATQPVA